MPPRPDRPSVSTHFREDHVLEDVLLLRWSTMPNPTELKPAYDRVLAARDAEELDRALRELAVAALNGLSALRRTYPHLVMNR